MAAAASGRGLLKGWLKNDIDNVIPEEDKRWNADIGTPILEDNRSYKKRIWSADDIEIPKDKRWSADISHPIPDDESFFKEKKWSADDNVIPEFMRWSSSDIGKEILLEDKRWSFHEEISKLFEHSLKASFPDFKEEEPLILASQEGEGESPGDYNCQNVLTIWPKLRKSHELRKTYPHIQKPKDIGESIRKNLPAYASHMFDQDTSIEDVGFVAFALSRKWMAESVHKMLHDGIDTWAPKFRVERVLIAFPSLDEELYVGLSRAVAIALTHFRMLKFSKVAAAFSLAHDSAQARYFQNLPHWGEGILRRLFSIKNRGGDVVIDGEGILPFILAARDFHNSSEDLAALRVEIEVLKADWIVYVTPVRQQEYIEMCFTVSKFYTASLKNEYPVAKLCRVS